MMSPNKEQVKSGLRTLIATFGGVLAGYFMARGWASSETVMSVLTSEAFLSLSASAIVFIWGIVSKTRNNLLITAGQQTNDKGEKLVASMTLTDSQVAAEVNPQVTARVTAVKDKPPDAKPSVPD